MESQLLTDLRALDAWYSEPERWCKGAGVRGVSRCVVMALNDLCGERTETGWLGNERCVEALNYLTDVANTDVDGEWNDTRTFPEVKALIAEAIRRCEQS